LFWLLEHEDGLDYEFSMENGTLGGYTPDWINQTMNFTAQLGTEAKEHWVTLLFSMALWVSCCIYKYPA
jgi:hypothetical protein